jgi:hypothetical protein
MRPKTLNLTDEQKELVYQMFFGPYREEWKENGIVENSEKVIAERLGVPFKAVYNEIEKLVNAHFKKIEKLRNLEIQMEKIETN